MKRLLAIGALVLVAIVVIWHPPAAAPPAAVAMASPHPTRAAKTKLRPTPGVAVVYVAGAVQHPGLYAVPGGARANDAIRLAGGFRNDADQAGVNLAAHVADGDEVRIPVLGEPTARARNGIARARRSPPPKKVLRPVNVNDANSQELAAVPGIGPAIAARIVEVRERDGTFDSLDQLLDVAGMSPARLDRASPYLYI